MSAISIYTDEDMFASLTDAPSVSGCPRENGNGERDPETFLILGTGAAYGMDKLLLNSAGGALTRFQPRSG